MKVDKDLIAHVAELARLDLSDEEIEKFTPQLKEIVSKEPTEPKILEEALRQGMVSLRQDGILKALNGLVSIEEVLRETTEM